MKEDARVWLDRAENFFIKKQEKSGLKNTPAAKRPSAIESAALSLQYGNRSLAFRLVPRVATDRSVAFNLLSGRSMARSVANALLLGNSFI